MKTKTTRLDPFGLMIEPEIPNDDIRNLSISSLRTLFYEARFLLMRGFQSLQSAEDFSNYCAGWGEISIWPFGKVLELVEQSNPEDHIFDHNYVPLHWDGMYRPQVPELQIFSCVSAPLKDQGGRTTFSNTAIAVSRAKSEELSLWKRASGAYRRKMEFYDSKTIAPVLTTHPACGFSVIRYNEPPHENDSEFINHPAIEFTGVSASEVSELHRSLREALYSPHNFYAHAWQTGDVVISDNYTLLHGREAFTSGAPRHLRRVHILGTPPLDNPHLVSHS